MIGSTYYAFYKLDGNIQIKGILFLVVGSMTVTIRAIEIYEIVETSNFIFYLFPTLTSMMLLILILTGKRPANQKLANLASIEFFLLSISIMVSAIDVIRK